MFAREQSEVFPLPTHYPPVILSPLFGRRIPTLLHAFKEYKIPIFQNVGANVIPNESTLHFN